MTHDSKKNRCEQSDLELVQQACAEDLPAFEQLVVRYQQRVYGFVYGMTSDREEAAGLTQEVFVNAWKAIGQFREPVGFFAWIYRIALYRTLRGHPRHRKVKPSGFNEFDPQVKSAESYRELSRKGSVLRRMSLSAFQKKMNEALLLLPEKARAVVIMHDVQGLTVAEICAAMNCSEGRTRQLLESAHEQLHIQLAKRQRDLAGLLVLKNYERPDSLQVEKNRQNILRAVRAVHKQSLLHCSPDKSMGWIFTRPRYGVILLFILFLVLVLLDHPMPQGALDRAEIREEMKAEMSPVSGGITNKYPVSVFLNDSELLLKTKAPRESNP